MDGFYSSALRLRNVGAHGREVFDMLSAIEPVRLGTTKYAVEVDGIRQSVLGLLGLETIRTVRTF